MKVMHYAFGKKKYRLMSYTIMLQRMRSIVNVGRTYETR